MLDYDFEESIGYWIFSTAHQISQTMNEELADLGITFRQWEVLVWLSLVGETSQSELARRMRIEAPTLVGVLDRMTRDGWIRRIPDPRDRRKKLVQCTEQVEPVWAEMTACARRVRAKAIRGIDEATLSTIRDALATMRRNLADDDAEHPSDVPADSVGGASCERRRKGENRLLPR